MKFHIALAFAILMVTACNAGMGNTTQKFIDKVVADIKQNPAAWNTKTPDDFMEKIMSVAGFEGVVQEIQAKEGNSQTLTEEQIASILAQQLA